MRTMIYPGTFDPITNGHVDILERAICLFDEVIVAIAKDNYKNNLFSFEERIELAKEACKAFPCIRVEAFEGLLVDFVKTQKARAIIRGLRAVSDFEYEFQLAMMNKRLESGIETIFLMAASKYSFLSSSIIKQVAVLDGAVTGLVPIQVEEALKLKVLAEKNVKEE